MSNRTLLLKGSVAPADKYTWRDQTIGDTCLHGIHLTEEDYGTALKCAYINGGKALARASELSVRQNQISEFPTVTPRLWISRAAEKAPAHTVYRWSRADHWTSGEELAPDAQKAPKARDEAKIKFSDLSAKWRKEIVAVSSSAEIVMNFNYQQIIGMGREALPYIFEDLQTNGGHWFWALRAITSANPVASEDRGNIAKMTQSWLEWWKTNSTF